MPIVWLASYPKSGNTWMRGFLANYLSGSGKPVHINDYRRFSLGEHHADLYEAVSGKPFAELDNAALNRLRPQVGRDDVDASAHRWRSARCWSIFEVRQPRI